MFVWIGKVILTMTVIAVPSGELLNAQSRCPLDGRAEDLAPRFSIRGGAIKMPIGAFLLVRKKNDIGVIRLTNIDPSATGDLGKSMYESFFPVGLPAGSSKVTRGTGEIDVKPEGGWMRGFAYQPGPHRARIGKWSFSFVGPSTLYMSSYHHSGDQEYEFAPTSACNYSEVDAQDKRLRWFRYDRNANVVLPLADLPK